MKVLSLRPYPGHVRVCGTQKEYQREHKRLHGVTDEGLTARNSGRMSGKTLEPRGVEYLVWAAEPCYMAHELSHVILNTFESVGIDPREAGGEPFCYMLSQLMLEAELAKGDGLYG